MNEQAKKACTVGTIADIMRAWAPENWAEGFDNCGLLVGDADSVVHGVYVALDPRPAAVREAIARGCDMLVTHHPMFLSGGVQKLVAQSGDMDTDTAMLCLQRGVALYAAHTNLDRAAGGVNDCLCEALGWENEGVFKDDLQSGDPDMPCGLARLARLPKTTTLEQAARHTAHALGLACVEYVGDPAMEVSRAALCGGAGGSLISDALAAGVQLLVTGEAKHHQRVHACERGLGLIVAGHAETEQVVLHAIAAALQTALNKIQYNLPVIFEENSAVTHHAIG